MGSPEFPRFSTTAVCLIRLRSVGPINSPLDPALASPTNAGKTEGAPVVAMNARYSAVDWVKGAPLADPKSPTRRQERPP